MNLPTVLTLMRIGAVPILAILYLFSFSWVNLVCCVIFTVAALTDLLDGYLARKWEQTSSFGAFLDPVADKMLVVVVLLLLLYAHPSFWMLLPAVVIIGREITVSALREWMAEKGKRGVVAVSSLGKYKTTLQMIALGMLIYEQPIGFIPIMNIGYILLYIAAGLTIWSMLLYLKSARPEFELSDSV
ncbi:MAG TPA: CDP-diacylglycerol--glycerol-3-phosphate 3-phosphatidyltransferase [Gammaproteobacteria bacterium]|nr:CDP-diacylglycerol--glycerol-3-phosphate 3-phosphatidyltransferase [Gammaproteobacteria bacterium]